MPRKRVCGALVALFALAVSGVAQGQVTIDVTKVNCDQFVHHKISEPRLIAAWLSGYYNAKLNTNSCITKSVSLGSSPRGSAVITMPNSTTASLIFRPSKKI
jgi:hypothetical protein